MNQTYSATTHDICITVEPAYVPQRSDPGNGRWVWSYDISIVNKGSDTVQLKERMWDITDATGKRERVQGAGVVGEQPILNGGDMFRYKSTCPLPTSSGFMKGAFTFQNEDGRRFDVQVPAFSLDLPHAARTLN